MRAKIAVATVSGRAYYKLVKELKERGLLFLSLVPGETIPSTVKVVISTEKERHLIKHPNVVLFDENNDAKTVISEAHRIASGKEVYQEVAIGVDPGKTFGIAVLCDRNISRKEEGLSLEETVDTILSALKEYPAKHHIIRIGDGVPRLAEELVGRLRRVLPDDVEVETVSERGTSHSGNESRGRKLSDADSAVRIAQKKGNRA
ncbi:MAG: hypothetical protein ACE5NN_06515 [Candidatus Bathyarchaeia archaeon]